jgi:simple sugar transport system substrate-binding protein
MVVIWAYTWFDPAKEADAAKAMIEQGVDVIMQHTDSTAPQAAAQEAGNVFTFGQASDMAQFKPTPRISSIIDNWAPYYIERVQAALDGTWTSTHTWGGIGDGEVEIGEITEAVPAEVKAEAEALLASIADGELPPLHRAHQQAGRHALAGRGAGGDRRGAGVHELLRRGHDGRDPS